MARPVVLSNGQMLVGLNEHGFVHDFYYPYVGLDNLTTARSVNHKIGVWVDGVFSWVDDGSWDNKVNFESEALVSKNSFTKKDLGIRIDSRDFIDTETNTFIRRFKVHNLDDNTKQVRLFLHQVFEISRSGRADTAFYVPEVNYILDYKGRIALLIYGQQSDGQSFDQYAIGSYSVGGDTGTYKDAEDGELSGNPVEHGGVDSVMRLSFEISPNTNKEIDYWIVASSSQYESEQIHNKMLVKGIDKIEERTRHYWQKWLTQGHKAYTKIPAHYQDITKKSLLVIKAHMDARGGILASADSSILNYWKDYYCYVWPRDGAYAVWPLIRMGFYDEAKRFFEFCRDTMHKDGYMMHKYQPDRSIGSTWHPLVHNNRRELAIQEDETASIIAILWELYEYTGDKIYIGNLYSTLIQPAADFMSDFIDDATNLPHPSYDLWEEKFLTHTYTTALVTYALSRASDFARVLEYPDDSVKYKKARDRIQQSFDRLYSKEDNRYIKGFIQDENQSYYDKVLDISSLYGVVMFTQIKLDDPKIMATIKEAKKHLNQASIGGYIRYEGDNYLRPNQEKCPNPWHVTTMWMAQVLMQVGKNKEAKELIDWTLNLSLPSGILGEQLDPDNGNTVGVAPLVWSHAELINSLLDYSSIK